MGKVADMIKKLIETPEDVSILPDLLKEAEALESAEANAMSLVEKVQATNRNLLSQIVTQKEPEKKDEKTEITSNDITKAIIEEMEKGVIN